MTETNKTPETTQNEYRLFADSEDTFTLGRPSVGAFRQIRRIALDSAAIPLAMKFDICTELGIEWRKELKIENRRDLEKLLSNMAEPDPGRLGEKILESKNIRELPRDETLSTAQATAQMATVLFDLGDYLARADARAIDPERKGQLLVGNVRKAGQAFFAAINISPEEDLSQKATFRALTTSDDEFSLAPASVATLEKLGGLQLRTPSIPKKDRQQLAREMNVEFSEPEPADAVSKPDYWIESARILLRGAEVTQANKETIDAGEVNRALAVFFARSDGLF